MAQTHVLRHKRGDTLLLTLSGKVLLTGEGEGAIEQTFPSAGAAAEHLERVLGLRRREGYVVAEVREPDGEPAPAAGDPVASAIQLDRARSRATVTFKGAEVARGLCAGIVARLAADAPRSVQLICDRASPGQAFSDALAGTSLPSVEAFVFDTHFQTVTRQRESSCGDLAAVLAALPSVSRLFATGQSTLAEATHAQLRELCLLGDPISRPTAAALGASRFPALETVALQLCSDAGPGPDRAVAAALRSLVAPALRVIHVDCIDDVTAFLQALTASPLPGSWRTLRLGGVVDDEDELLGLLAERAPTLRGLDVLALPLADNLSEEGIAKVRAQLPSLVDIGEVPAMVLPARYDAW